MYFLGGNKMADEKFANNCKAVQGIPEGDKCLIGDEKVIAKCAALGGKEEKGKCAITKERLMELLER